MCHYDYLRRLLLVLDVLRVFSYDVRFVARLCNCVVCARLHDACLSIVLVIPDLVAAP